MRKKIIEYILIISLIAATATGVGIGVWSHNSQETYTNEKTVVLTGETQTEQIKVSLSGITPGASAAYTVHLKASKGDSFALCVDCTKTGADSMAPFIDVQVLVDGQHVGQLPLSSLLGEEQLEFRIKFDNTTDVEVKIVYSMSLQVGDEAQNTAADFDLMLTTTR